MDYKRIYIDGEGFIQGVEYPGSRIKTLEDFKALKLSDMFRDKTITDEYVFADPAMTVEYVTEDFTTFQNDYTSQLYFADGEVRCNDGKDLSLMPAKIIKAKHFKRLKAKLDLELEKESPDAIVGLKLQREIEKCKKWTDKEWYEQALKNLDEDGHDKPVIRDKIAQKISELE